MKETHEHAVKRGTKSRKQGGIFEARVRKDLESKRFICDKWTNNVEFGYYDELGNFIPKKWKDLTLKNGEHYPNPNCRLVKAKNKWAGPNRPMMMGAGFPDFIAFRLRTERNYESEQFPRIEHEIIGVESKINGKLDREEKEKCKWLLENNIFSKILVASKTKIKNKIVVEYREFNQNI